MNTYKIQIIESGAKKLLDDMAELNLITVLPIGSRGPNGSDGQKATLADRREAIISLAGSWEGMPENDFQEFLSEAKRSGRETKSCR